MSSHIETISLHAGQSPDPTTGSRAVPIHQTTSYVFKNTEHAANLFGLKEFGNIYTRIMNPTTDVLEQRIAALEGGTAAVATASGMSAIFLAIHTICKAGDHIVASASLYGGTDTLFRHTLPRLGITVTIVEDLTASKLADAITETTKLVYVETVGNPKGDVPDFNAISAAAHDHNLPVMVDNTFAPGLCAPIKHGADIVVHSLTKWLGGHGTTIGGIIVDGGSFNWGNGRFLEFTEPDASYHGLKYWDVFGDFPGLGNVAFAIKARVQGLRNIGMSLSPASAFQLLQGIETLPLRMEKHVANASALANWLKAHPKVAWVNYTGFSDHASYELCKHYLNDRFPTVFTFGLMGGYDAAKSFIDSVKLASHLANVGDAKTLVIHPASTTHQQLGQNEQLAAGVTPDMIRVSVGLEHMDDICSDFEQAMA
ncbi:MAG: O-acetylhomoserine aminocarboxypropyltransferase/cysteine synthase [Candidatus Margulisbacteria bacterium]|nr:O-acetylhomoserine aminocarboxypropyltransferase/cysteine synthase [Candidatus Margulisiibacteriota bacterium]